MTGEFGIAVQAMLYLGRQENSLSSAALSELLHIHPVRIRKVMAALKRAGLVSAREGVDGGYVLDCNPSKTSLRQISDALDMRFIPVWQTTDAAVEAETATQLGQLYDELEETCQAHLKGIMLQRLMPQKTTATARAAAGNRKWLERIWD